MKKIIYLAVGLLFATGMFFYWYKTTPDPRVTINSYKSPQTHSLNADILWNLVNEHRQSIGLQPFIKSQELCSYSDARAQELHTDYSHKVFIERFRNSPYEIGENIVNAPNEPTALRMWLNSPPHKKAIESDMRYSCLSCSGAYCEEIFTNF